MAAEIAFERRPGPLARTAMELEHLRRVAAFRRERELATRRRLRESDLLLELVEECRLKRLVPLPTRLWIHIVHFVGSIDGTLRDELGINRNPDHVSDVLFLLQEELLRAHREEREPRLARIIPLFRDLPPAADA